ncbi:MAG: hypothetical protein LW878_08555 [Proteobacteria bacterium]|jgi:hypothetical protein|nr:hypothetical protein [Pseudomonadota bacterium]
MSTEVKSTKTVYKSDSSIMSHPYQMPKKADEMAYMPTWMVIVVLFIAFFLLKALIYIKDEARHGK